VVLSVHAGYRCRRTGVCCSSGWPIPVEQGRLKGLEEALGDARLGLERTGWPDAAVPALLPREAPLPEGTAARLGHDAAGRCLFLETRGGGDCAVHRQLGPAALPAACRQFPRLCVIEEARAAVSLSHYCPTAAALLLEERCVERVEAPTTFAAPEGLEGLDARGVGARLLRPGVLLDTEAHEEWERRGLALLASGDDPDSAVARLAAAAERARLWRPGDGAVAARVTAAFSEAADPGRRWEERLGLAEHVRLAAPPAWRASAARPGERAFEDRVRPAWRRERPLLGRYLCARFFACWALYQGGGLRSHAAWTRLVLDTLAVEAARRAEASGTGFERRDLLEAIRETDRRLLHLAEAGSLARGLEL
jgi:hypothetical protein